jgi:hypothetical protein
MKRSAEDNLVGQEELQSEGGEKKQKKTSQHAKTLSVMIKDDIFRKEPMAYMTEVENVWSEEGLFRRQVFVECGGTTRLRTKTKASRTNAGLQLSFDMLSFQLFLAPVEEWKPEYLDLFLQAASKAPDHAIASLRRLVDSEERMPKDDDFGTAFFQYLEKALFLL